MITCILLTSFSINSALAPQKLSVEMKIYNAIDKVKATVVIPSKELKGKDVSNLINTIRNNDKFFYYEGDQYRDDLKNTTSRFFTLLVKTTKP